MQKYEDLTWHLTFDEHRRVYTGKLNHSVDAAYGFARLPTKPGGRSMQLISLYFTAYQEEVYGSRGHSQGLPRILPSTTVLQDCTSVGHDHHIESNGVGGGPSSSSHTDFVGINSPETVHNTSVLDSRENIPGSDVS